MRETLKAAASIAKNSALLLKTGAEEFREFSADVERSATKYNLENKITILNKRINSAPDLSNAEKAELYREIVTYSTLFKSLPNRPVGIDQSGYSDDWPDISKRMREACGYKCDSCKVDLSHAPGLLHVHHIDGNKRHNQSSNLRPLCADCHRKQPNHHAMYITKSDMDIIQAARRNNGIFEDEGDWNLALELADTAVHGLIHKYRVAGKACPQIGYEVQGANQRVIGELELAWPKHRRGIAIDSKVAELLTQQGWHVVTVGEALRDINNRSL